MKKFIIMLLFGCSLFVCGCSSNDTPENPFVVGLECDYAPFNWTDSSKNATNYPIFGTSLYADGYDVQIAKMIAEGLGKTLVIKAIAWEGLTEALQNGQIDAIIAGMSPTEERKQSIDFTDAYYTSTHVLVMLNNSQYVTGTTLNDFSGARVVGQIETLYDSLIDQLAGVEHLTPMPDVPTIITNITSQRADITILEEPVAMGVVAQNPALTYVKLASGFTVSEEDVAVSVGLRKADTELKEQINTILASISTATRTELMSSAISRAGE